MFSSHQLVNSCNNGARRMERTEQMYTIQKQMEFGKIKVQPSRPSLTALHFKIIFCFVSAFFTNLFTLWSILFWMFYDRVYFLIKKESWICPQPFPLVSSSRWLQKRGELAVCTEELSIFWKAFSHRSYYLFLFNDVLIVTKKKRWESEPQPLVLSFFMGWDQTALNFLMSAQCGSILILASVHNTFVPRRILATWLQTNYILM